MLFKYLFPDAKLRQKQTIEKGKGETDWEKEKMQTFLKKLNLMKSSSFDNTGLLNKLAACLSLVTDFGNTKALAQLWKEFLNELRFRYDSSVLISDLQSSKSNSESSSDSKGLIPPDLSRCQLHQKLQMINCCIKKKQGREALEKKSLPGDWNNMEDSEDEFYDCEDDDQTEKDNVREKTKYSPEGRLKKFGNLTILQAPNEPLYVPITQVMK